MKNIGFFFWDILEDTLAFTFTLVFYSDDLH